MRTSHLLHRDKPPLTSFGFTGIGPYYWVGKCDNGIEYLAGQTFKAPANGQLRSIRLFSSMVYGTTHATLSLFEFNSENFSWARQCSETHQQVTKQMEGQWIQFDIADLELSKDAHYGFKLSCNSGGMLAIAECPWHIANPYADGVEWIGSSQMLEGRFHKDFDLAFEALLEA